VHHNLLEVKNAFDHRTSSQTLRDRDRNRPVVARIRFIRRAKELGFKLSEISQLLSLRVDPDTTCADVRKQTELKIADVEEKIRVLQGIKTALKKLAASCVGTGPISECPILEALDSQDEGLVRKESLRHEDETTNRSF
jgi:MerR family mercuric resistance operon transcriptional regulator